MKQTVLLTLLAALLLPAGLLTLSGCAEEEASLLVPSDYPDWDRTVSETVRRQIPGHGDTFRRIYINDVGTTVEPTGGDEGVRYDYPIGTILVKEAYNEDPTADADPDGITAMVKSPGADESRGGWIWISKDPETGAEDRSLGEYCLSCHESANEEHPYGDRNSDGEYRDFVFYPYRGDS